MSFPLFFTLSRDVRTYFSAIDRSKLREEFLIYLDDATRFLPFVVVYEDEGNLKS